MAKADGEEEYRRFLGDLYGLRRAGVKLGLERTEQCLAALGHPDRDYEVVHIGGTNGKGSTVAFVAAILQAIGLRVGVFSSPHLSRLTERFVIDGQAVATGALLAANRAVGAAGGEELTFFERITTMAAWLFAQRAVDVGIFEVGLGGRLDSTNALHAQVAAVTGVALDHQEFLGHTLREIAAEKAGIFKAGQRVVVGAAGLEQAVPWLVDAAQRVGVAKCVVVDRQRIERVPTDLGLAGTHQRANAACAVAVIEQLFSSSDRPVTDFAIAAGLRGTRLPGRMEILRRAPTVLVDGAHNPHGATALMRALADAPPRRRIAVLGMSADKDVDAMVRIFAVGAAELIATAAAHPRALPAADLEAIMARVAPDTPRLRSASVAEALRAAMAICDDDDLVMVTGSLFVVAQAREFVLAVVPDPIPVTDPLPIRGSRRE